MRSLWDDREAAGYVGDLAQRVYTSRLLGRDPSLVLHGGGNTSVKIRECNILGEEEDILYVKGSGWDLATIEEEGFSPVRLKHLIGLSELQELTDVQMAAELKSNMTMAGAPTPSVETILHAILPYRYVDHTHADALISVSNTPGGKRRVREAYGDDVVIVPYVMPGFLLARLCAQIFPRQAGERTVGMVLMNHGLISFGDTARESYERMIELANRAEHYLREKHAWHIPKPRTTKMTPGPTRAEIASLRRDVSLIMGAPAILTTHRDAEALAFANHPNVKRLSRSGPATPDHVIRTKRLPMLGTNLTRYRVEYQRYVAANRRRSGRDFTMLDPAPRVILDDRFGMITAGRSVREAAIAADIYRQTMTIVQRAAALEAYRALPARHIFDVEYWDLEQAKLRAGGEPAAMAGEVVLVTGAASGIGKACVEAFLEAGAAVVALDANPAVAAMFDRPDVLGLCCDVADRDAVDQALNAAVLTYGGLDMLILNAGIFPGGHEIRELPDDEWERVLRVNLDANLRLLRFAHPLLELAPRQGRVVVIGSRNVTAPGPGAAAYSASKAALTQLARVAALEWGNAGIRVNVIHPDAVFDTGIWTDDVLRARAGSYGLSVDAYKRRNVLNVEVSSRDVARLAVALCGPIFARTTGAQIPIDGGNERVI